MSCIYLCNVCIFNGRMPWRAQSLGPPTVSWTLSTSGVEVHRGEATTRRTFLPLTFKAPKAAFTSPMYITHTLFTHVTCFKCIHKFWNKFHFVYGTCVSLLNRPALRSCRQNAMMRKTTKESISQTVPYLVWARGGRCAAT